MNVQFSVWMWMLSILLFGTVVTLAMNSAMQDRSQQLSMEQFNRQADVAAKQLESAIEKNKAFMVALRGMFHTFESVSRDQFNQFVEDVNIDRLFPDMHALTWNEVVESQDVGAFERSVQLDDSLQAGGYPDFGINPKTAVGPHYVVTYVEPMSGNEGAFGLDVGANPVRRRAIEYARDLNEAVATAPITLVQEAGSQKGFLLIQPVYASAEHGDLESRRKEFRGAAVAVFRVGDLIAGSGGLDFSAIQIHDVTDSAAGLRDESEALYLQGIGSIGEGYQSLIRQIDVAGRQWEIEFMQSAQAMHAEGKLRQWAVPGLGALSTVLALLLVGYLATSRQRILLRAEELTVDLKKVNEELSRSNSDLGQFAYIASHDLQTPVRNIMGSLSMLEDAIEENSPEEIQRYLQYLQGSTLRMKTLISDLLDYASSGQLSEMETVDLDETMARVIASTSDICKSRNATLQVDAMPGVYGNEQQLERVFTNLVTNALKYSREEIEPHIQVSSKEMGNMYEIRIRDNGMGIDAEHQLSIFEPFKRLHAHHDIAGTGLGLAICSQILNKHDGFISVENSSPGGTTMLLQMPSGRAA